MKIFWAFGDHDVVVDHLSKIRYKAKGTKTIHLLAPMFKKPKTRTHHEIKQWDVTVKNVRTLRFSRKCNQKIFSNILDINRCSY